MHWDFIFTCFIDGLASLEVFLVSPEATEAWAPTLDRLYRDTSGWYSPNCHYI